MGLFANMSQSARRSALAVMMLAILLLCTAVAWIITASRSAVRPGETWYLISSADAIIGWQVTQRESVGAGGEAGYEIIFTGDGDSTVLWNRWRLNAAGTRGRYASEAALMQGPRYRTTGITRIDYEHPAVNLSQERGNSIRTLDKPLSVDATYIAEGRLIPTIVEVAKTGQPRNGEMVIDALMDIKRLTLQSDGTTTRDVDGRSMQLTTVTLQWLDENLAALTIRYLVDRDGGIAVIEHVAKDGQIAQQTSRTSLDAVRQRFPGAHRTRSALLQDDLLD